MIIRLSDVKKNKKEVVKQNRNLGMGMESASSKVIWGKKIVQNKMHDMPENHIVLDCMLQESRGWACLIQCKFPGILPSTHHIVDTQ